MNHDIKSDSSVKSATEESEEFRVSGIMISTDIECHWISAENTIMVDILTVFS